MKEGKEEKRVGSNNHTGEKVVAERNYRTNLGFGVPPVSEAMRHATAAPEGSHVYNSSFSGSFSTRSLSFHQVRMGYDTNLFSICVMLKFEYSKVNTINLN